MNSVIGSHRSIKTQLPTFHLHSGCALIKWWPLDCYQIFAACFILNFFFFNILVCGGAAGVLIVKIDEHATRVGVRLDRLQLVVFLSGN